LGRTNFLGGDALIFGDAKIFLHSRIATDSHGSGQVEQQSGLRIEYLIVPGRIVEGIKKLALLLGFHFSSPLK
jgi:hypothetical protein